MKLLLILCFSLIQAVQAQQLGWARLAIMDIGSLVKSAPLVGDTSLVRAYLVSGMPDEDARSIVVLQGLSDSGSTDINIDSHAGLIQKQIALGMQSEDLILNPVKSRSCIITQPYTLALERTTVIETDAPFNEYILASQPTLIELRHLHSENDAEYFKTIAIKARATGLSDIVIATKSRVYKFTIKIGGTPNEHTERIRLNAGACLR